MRRGFLACFIASLFVMQGWAISGSEFSDTNISKTYQDFQQFNQSGFVESGTYTTSDGESHITRPRIQWTQTNQSLVLQRTGACSVAVDSLNLKQEPEKIKESYNKKETFPSVSLSVKNPKSSKLLITMIMIQILSNIGIIYLLYLGMG